MNKYRSKENGDNCHDDDQHNSNDDNHKSSYSTNLQTFLRLVCATKTIFFQNY